MFSVKYDARLSYRLVALRYPLENNLTTNEEKPYINLLSSPTDLLILSLGAVELKLRAIAEFNELCCDFAKVCVVRCVARTLDDVMSVFCVRVHE